MFNEKWARDGSDDEQAGDSTIPAFIEVAPDSFRPVDECSADELRAAADGLLLQAKALMDEAGNLYELADRKQ